MSDREQRRYDRVRPCSGEGDAMDLIRPNGMVERLGRGRLPLIRFDGYGRVSAGHATADDLRTAAENDRRRRRRPRQDPLRGRLIDVTA